MSEKRPVNEVSSSSEAGKRQRLHVAELDDVSLMSATSDDGADLSSSTVELINPLEVGEIGRVWSRHLKFLTASLSAFLEKTIPPPHSRFLCSIDAYLGEDEDELIADEILRNPSSGIDTNMHRMLRYVASGRGNEERRQWPDNVPFKMKEVYEKIEESLECIESVYDRVDAFESDKVSYNHAACKELLTVITNVKNRLNAIHDKHVNLCCK